MAKNIPDRWVPYTPCGTVIEGTRIICFKVPIRKIFQRELQTIWDMETLLSTIPNLGAVIDLTNTQRYYNPAELQDAGVLYKKIFIPGRIMPPKDKVTAFFEAVDQFLSNDSDSLVGVHCTHGLNRTGYMVCRYMRDRLGIPAKKAISNFEEARGYKIERDNYIADLLGKTPPPPSFGSNTIVKPLNRKRGRPSSNSDDHDVNYNMHNKRQDTGKRVNHGSSNHNPSNWRHGEEHVTKGDYGGSIEPDKYQKYNSSVNHNRGGWKQQQGDNNYNYNRKPYNYQNHIAPNNWRQRDDNNTGYRNPMYYQTNSTSSSGNWRQNSVSYSESEYRQTAEHQSFGGPYANWKSTRNDMTYNSPMACYEEIPDKQYTSNNNDFRRRGTNYTRYNGRGGKSNFNDYRRPGSSTSTGFDNYSMNQPNY